MELGSFGISKTGGSGGGSSAPSEDISYGIASGTDTYSVTLSPAITSYTTGLFIEVKFTNSNQSSAPTLDPNGLGAKTIVNRNGGELYLGQIQSNGVYNLTYDGTNLILNSNPFDGDFSFYRKSGTTNYESWFTSVTTASLSVNNTTHGANVMRLYPFVVPNTITLDRIGVKVTIAGTASSVMRLGIYRSSNNIPSTLVIDAGTIPLDSTGFNAITINTTLTAGLYFLAQNNNAVSSPTCVISAVASSISPLGNTTTNSASSVITNLTLVETYGAFSNNISGNTFTPQVTGHLLIYVRRAS